MFLFMTVGICFKKCKIYDGFFYYVTCNKNSLKMSKISVCLVYFAVSFIFKVINYLTNKEKNIFLNLRLDILKEVFLVL